MARLLLMSGRLVALAALAVAVPLSGGRQLVPLARTAGWLCGRAAGLPGSSSSLYRHDTGF